MPDPVNTDVGEESKRVKSDLEKAYKRNMYDEPYWQIPSNYDERGRTIEMRETDTDNRFRCLEATMARIEDKLNRITIALGCDDKTEIIIIREDKQ